MKTTVLALTLIIACTGISLAQNAPFEYVDGQKTRFWSYPPVVDGKSLPGERQVSSAGYNYYDFKATDDFEVHYELFGKQKKRKIKEGETLVLGFYVYDPDGEAFQIEPEFYSLAVKGDEENYVNSHEVAHEQKDPGIPMNPKVWYEYNGRQLEFELPEISDDKMFIMP